MPQSPSPTPNRTKQAATAAAKTAILCLDQINLDAPTARQCPAAQTAVRQLVAAARCLQDLLALDCPEP